MGEEEIKAMRDREYEEYLAKRRAEWEHKHRSLGEKIDDLGLGWVMLIVGIGVPLAVVLIFGVVLWVIALITGTTDQWKW